MALEKRKLERGDWSHCSNADAAPWLGSRMIVVWGNALHRMPEVDCALPRLRPMPWLPRQTPRLRSPSLANDCRIVL